jgi:hypothetical protein
LAGGGAAALIVLLVASVAVIWLVGRSSASGPLPLAESPQTPTPRALAFRHLTQTPQVASDAGSTDDIVIEGAPASSSSGAAPASGGGPAAAILKVPGGVTFASLASGSWSATDDTLVNTGSDAVAERWLDLAKVPDSTYAIEAEMRVTGVLKTVCDQSFGLVGGSPDLSKVFGAGLIFPCDSGQPQARLTDVTVWQDGYNADAALGEAAYDPGDAWHTYRFEIHGDRLRLLVDGVAVANGSPQVAPGWDNATQEAGIWSQGVALEVRRLAVIPLPAE